MNTRFLKTLSLRAALLLGSWGVVHAQSAITRANIPFEFAAGGAMRPAGDYSIEVADISGVIVLHSSSGASVALLTTISGTTAAGSPAKFIFEKRDGMPYLAAVEWPEQSARAVSPFKGAAKLTTAALR